MMMYDSLSAWWPLLSAPADYAEEAAAYRRLLLAACDGQLDSVLELGSGGGNNAFHLKSGFSLTLVDISPGMLAVSRALNPECEHVEGDMRTVRLDREFDGVFIHDAISYMITAADLRRALDTAYLHCRPGGVALFAPDHLRETFEPDTECGGHDGERRSLRYLAWTWDPDPDDCTCTVDYAFMMRDETGSTHVERERHIEGLFTGDEWLRLLAEAGFVAELATFTHSEVPDRDLSVFVARRPPGSDPVNPATGSLT